MPAPKSNKNAAGHKNPRSGQNGKAAMMSMPHEEWQLFKAAAMTSEGAALSEEECVEIWRNVDRLARKAFIERHHDLSSPAIMA